MEDEDAREEAFIRRQEEEATKTLAIKPMRCRLCEHFILNCFNLCMFLPLLQMRHFLVSIVDDPPPNDRHILAPMEEDDDDDNDEDEDEKHHDTFFWSSPNDAY